MNAKYKNLFFFYCGIDFSWLFMDAVWRNVDGIFLGPFLGISRVFGFEIESLDGKPRLSARKKPLNPNRITPQIPSQ
jgi:hypothetical protein